MQNSLAHVSELPEETPHYLRAVTQMGDSREVTANQDIFTQEGILLLAKGSRINSNQFDLLARHKLSISIDQSLLVQNAVNADQLSADAAKILAEDLFLARMVVKAGGVLMVRQALAQLALPSPVQFRLTVMKEQRPNLFEHVIRVSIWCHALAQQTKLPEIYRDQLLLAAICHDMGEMHTDPELLTSGHSVTMIERCYLHVHPITSYLVVSKVDDFSGMAAQAILHHHERLDGSGYPYGLQKERIHPLSQYIAVADTADAILRRFDLLRLQISFALNKTRFDARLIKALRELVHDLPFDSQLACKSGEASLQLHHIADLLEGWLALHAMLCVQMKAGAAQNSPIGFLFERMDGVHSLVLQMGFNPDDLHGMQTLAQEDPGLQQQLQTMLNEMEWILNEMANEIERRSPLSDGIPPNMFEELVQQLREIRAP
ncbi:HD-GYP domain-containing protein [Iodobacter fluviatilis]|uniref:Cyclic di-GMP phosphodiesterase response regulator RpfG n=1 Tax=Iodobacter fluviatilis TaxID=537 RepID=A0A377Q3G6_9NEIS|nr:HD domain-containing phosphohydrolase [Iodobacter fluviatilis]TCU84150.1 HD-GYP domain-containing protein (c-di-GMP phosphodiesterase class II) [Iodobacter fluviatilis]STQ89764.1 Cyclic di-GMP phosphodiesterase response regulator RpfG [Iodobacter fluviatilis]